MKPFIVVPDGLDSSLFKKLASLNHFEVHPEKKVSREELKKLLPKTSGLILRSATTFDAELAALAPHLKIIIRAGEGTDNIDKKVCAEKQIKVANTPGANNNSAAEHALALLLSTLRHIPMANETMHKGLWEKNSFTGMELWKKKVGIVGFGRIGQIFAQRISGFEPEVSYFDPFVNQDKYKKCTDLKTLFLESDIISIHMPLLPQTKNLINHELLSLMKPHAILINAARGGIVDENALYTILSEKKIKAAAFDVFSTEPILANDKLLSLSNFIMTPHLGASTEEAQFRVGEMAIHQMEIFFTKNELLNEVK